MRKFLSLFLLIILTSFSTAALAEDLANDTEFDEILSQDLPDLSVISIAKRSQRLSDAPAAVYVITQEDIRRAGIYSIPEALRLVPGVQVAKLSTDRWAVSARGFNSALNNKLLVLIDGRAIYTPVFSGVYWGDQGTSINDIDRIEVIRGPGASLYGANAVNGVINIITKSAKNTQGTLVSATTTLKGNGLYEARQGGKTKKDLYYRIYGQHMDGAKWSRERAGFRTDGKTEEGDNFTFQGDAYYGDQNASLTTPIFTPPFTETIRSKDDVSGGNVLGRWTRKISYDSEISLQSYLDHYSRNEANFAQNISTADVLFQHNYRINDRNYFIWGSGARIYYQDLQDNYAASVDEENDTHQILNLFAQNEYAIVPDKLYLTAGSKFEYNDFTGLEVQPTVRISWHATKDQTFWAAISRASRTPSIIEEDISFLALVTPSPLTEYRLIGNKDQESENLIAYEVGHRIQLAHNLSFDTALFFNNYRNLQTIAAPGAPSTGQNGNIVIPYKFNNSGYGDVYGAEFYSNWKITNDWRLAGSYTYLKMNLDVESGTALTLKDTERMAPRHQFSIQSYFNITDGLHWDNIVYYVDNISPPVDSYVRYDTRIAYLVQPGMEISLIGRNLVDKHSEFPTTPQSELDRSFIGQVLWKF